MVKSEKEKVKSEWLLIIHYSLLIIGINFFLFTFSFSQIITHH
jgi:hypothetical protein